MEEFCTVAERRVEPSGLQTEDDYIEKDKRRQRLTEARHSTNISELCNSRPEATPPLLRQLNQC